MLERRDIRRQAVALANTLPAIVGQFTQPPQGLNSMPFINITTPSTFPAGFDVMAETNNCRTMALVFEIRATGSTALATAEDLALSLETLIPFNSIIQSLSILIELAGTEISQGSDGIQWAKVTQFWNVLFLPYADNPGPQPGDDVLNWAVEK